MRGPRVSFATGWNIKSGGREEYLDSFLTEAVSAALLAEWDLECRYESARVLTTITSHVRGLPPCQGINASPPGHLPSSLVSRQAPWYGDTCCSYVTGNNVIDGLMPGYVIRGLFTHEAVNPPIDTQTHIHTHTYLVNGPFCSFSGTTRVSRYQKGKTNLDFTRDSEWQ